LKLKTQLPQRGIDGGFGPQCTLDDWGQFHLQMYARTGMRLRSEFLIKKYGISCQEFFWLAVGTVLTPKTDEYASSDNE